MMIKEITSDMIIAFMIGQAKKLKSQNESMTFINAFDQAVNNSYDVAVYFLKVEDSHFEYIETFHSAAMGEIDLPGNYIRTIIKCCKPFKEVSLDTEALQELRTQIIERRKYIDELTEQTADIRRILGKQTASFEIIDKLYQLDNWCRITEKNIEMGFVYNLWFYSFGYIEGKRAERQRKKLNRKIPENIQ